MNLTESYEPAIEQTIYSAAEIAEAIDRLAGEITVDFSGKPLLLLGVLKGALYVVSDLARAIAAKTGGPGELIVDYLSVTSYGNRSRSSGEVRVLKDTNELVTGRNVIIVEDIVDNGLTLQYLRSLLKGREPATLRSCVLFDKPYHRSVDVPVEYVGLTVPDAFVVGYGLDYQELFRNLPFLAQLRPSIFSKES